jgi:hypothetical protein
MLHVLSWVSSCSLFLSFPDSCLVTCKALSGEGPDYWRHGPVSSPQFPLLGSAFLSEVWGRSVNSSREVLEALGGETHYKYSAFIISLPGGTVLPVEEANTCKGRKSQCRAPGGSWELASWYHPSQSCPMGMKPLDKSTVGAQEGSQLITPCH